MHGSATEALRKAVEVIGKVTAQRNQFHDQDDHHPLNSQQILPRPDCSRSIDLIAEA